MDTRPAAERIADLFQSMAPRRKTLMGMLTFCATPQTADALDAEVNRTESSSARSRNEEWSFISSAL